MILDNIFGIIKLTYSPDILHPTQCATLSVAESSIVDVEESASHIGDVDRASHPSCVPDTNPHTLQDPVERHL